MITHFICILITNENATPFIDQLVEIICSHHLPFFIGIFVFVIIEVYLMY